MKSKLFKGLSLGDLSRRLRRDLSLLTSLPESKIEVFGREVVEAVNKGTLVQDGRVSPASRKALSQSLSIEQEDVDSLTRFAAYFGARIGETRDTASNLADDVIEITGAASDKRQEIQSFFSLLGKVAGEFSKQKQQVESTVGGGHHLHGLTVYPEFRVWTPEVDRHSMSPEDYKPTILGFVPGVTLELELHDGENDTVISIRLDEDDIATLEKALKLGRMELEAAKQKLTRS